MTAVEAVKPQTVQIEVSPLLPDIGPGISTLRTTEVQSVMIRVYLSLYPLVIGKLPVQDVLDLGLDIVYGVVLHHLKSSSIRSCS